MTPCRPPWCCEPDDFETVAPPHNGSYAIRWADTRILPLTHASAAAAGRCASPRTQYLPTKAALLHASWGPLCGCQSSRVAPWLNAAQLAWRALWTSHRQPAPRLHAKQPRLPASVALAQCPLSITSGPLRPSDQQTLEQGSRSHVGRSAPPLATWLQLSLRLHGPHTRRHKSRG